MWKWGWPAFKATLMKVTVNCGIHTQFAEPSTDSWWVLRCWRPSRERRKRSRGKPLIKKLFSKLEASKCWTKKSQLSTLTNRTHTKGLTTRTSGKSCFAKSHSHPVPQAGDWVSQGNMLLSCISRTSQHPWKLEAWKLGLLWRNDLPQVLYIFLMSGTV